MCRIHLPENDKENTADPQKDQPRDSLFWFFIKRVYDDKPGHRDKNSGEEHADRVLRSDQDKKADRRQKEKYFIDENNVCDQI